MQQNSDSEKWKTVRLLEQAAERMGVKIKMLDPVSNFRIYEKNGKQVYVLEFVPELNGYVTGRVVNDKALVKRVLKKFNIPVPAGFVEKNIRKALDNIEQKIVRYPLVVKPIDGSMGHAVTADIKSKDWLIRAINEVFKYNRRTKGKPNSFLVEEYISGSDYRLLVLDNKVLTVLMRKPAAVIGDGVLNIGQLIDTFNAQPEIGSHKPLCPIKRDYELYRNLNAQHLTEKNVPAKGQKIVLRKNANVSCGGLTYECADRTHPQYKRLAVQIAKIFSLRFCSVDLIAPDIRKFEKYSVIEVNNTPGFDIHEKPYRGKPFPVAEHLIRAMFGEAK